MDFRQLKTFICVAESGSLSRASDRMRIAQPALSRQIKLLEHEVGVPLFDRHVRGMELTEAGSELLRRVSGVIRQLELTMQDVQSLHSEISGNVALALMPTVSTVFATRLVERTARELPEVSLRIREGYSVDVLTWIQRGDVDIAFLYGPSSDLHIRTKELLHEEVVLISPPGSLEGVGPQLGFDAVEKLPLVLPGRPYALRHLVESTAKKAGHTINVPYEVDSYWAIKSMVMSGLCHSFLPPASLKAELDQDLLKARSIGSGGLWRQLVLGVPSQRPNTRAADAVLELLLDEIASMIASGEWQAQPGADLRERI
ncbi:LysR family transcriptional regulator [Nitratireductor sp. XY-223]|uniref:LysR family transcriptional regulator n=1 Tax=Nitratireductor sp. XY-223 TaxID=2561926 RepID=UPI0010A9DE6C|nr:LysR family transcriptional regulator [Nitratireductor sp. XY-223]